METNLQPKNSSPGGMKLLPKLRKNSITKNNRNKRKKGRKCCWILARMKHQTTEAYIRNRGSAGSTPTNTSTRSRLEQPVQFLDRKLPGTFQNKKKKLY